MGNISHFNLGLIVSIAGFIWVVNSLKASNREASISSYLKTYEWTIEMDKSFIDHPEFDSYLKCDTTSLKNPKYDSIKIEAFAEYMLDNYDAILNNKSYFTIDTATENQWKREVVKKLVKYPLLRKVLRADTNLYSDSLKVLYKKSLEKGMSEKCK